VEIKGTWDSADTSAVSVSGYTTGVSNFINIYTTGSARHNGTALSGYKLQANVSGGAALTQSVIGNVTIDGLIITNTSIGNSSSVLNETTRYSSNIYKNNIIVGVNTRNSRGISPSQSSTSIVFNNIIYNFRNTTYSNGTGMGFPVLSYRVYNAYNNTVYNTWLGVYATTATNNISMGGTTDFNATTQSYNMSSDATASGTGSLTSKTASDQFVSTTNDFHLKVGADAIDAGTDLGSPYNVDIDGNTRTAPWDIGADEYVAAGNAVSPSWRIQGMKLQGVRFK
jgi:hypothetical protein